MRRRVLKAGVIHFIAEDDQEAIHICRRLLSFLPSNNLEEPPRITTDNDVDPNPALGTIVPVGVAKSHGPVPPQVARSSRLSDRAKVGTLPNWLTTNWLEFGAPRASFLSVLVSDDRNSKSADTSSGQVRSLSRIWMTIRSGRGVVSRSLSAWSPRSSTVAPPSE